MILNRSSVQRGLFRSTLFRTTTDEAKVNHGRGDMVSESEMKLNSFGSVPWQNHIQCVKMVSLS